MDFINEPSKQIAVTGEFDVAVAGGGIAGVASALAAARQGKRTVLIENLSNDTWKVGNKGRVYADAFGTYDGMPRLVVRYTYFD